MDTVLKPVTSVFQDWLFELPLQQQTVLVLAGRGPDGVGKYHPIKPLIARYRATVFRQAYSGRPMMVDEAHSTTFMSLDRFSSDGDWNRLLHIWFKYVDFIPHHYYMHLMHGAEICGYKHPEELFRRRWTQFYTQCCNDLHLYPESEQQLDRRLNDWDRKHWND